MNDNDNYISKRRCDKKDIRNELSQYYSLSKNYKNSISRFGLNKFLLFYVDLFNNDIPSGGRVLDLGCGTGTSTLYLKNNGFRAIGLDISHFFMLSASREPEAPSYVCASAEQIPFADGFFDAVGANSFIEHAPNVKLVIDEMYRVTKTGGKIIMHGPNLLSPLVPLVKAFRALAGQKISPVYGNGFMTCILTSIRNARIQRRKKNSDKAEIIYREPLLDDEIFTADDADATWYANPHDLIKLLANLGCKILITHKEIKGVRSTIGKVFPNALGLTIIAEK